MPDATIYDVAERAGVSISTVSRVLNAPVQVNEATRARVLSAIEELGFVPRAEATARARRGAGRIGVLTPFFTHASFFDRLRGVAAALAGSPYELIIYNVVASAQRDGYLTSLPVAHRVDGLIIMALPFDEMTTRRLLTHDLATVLVEVDHPAFSNITIDDTAGGRMAAEHFIRLGRRRCAFVGDADVPDYAIHTSDWRLESYRRTLADHGRSLPEAYIALAPHGMDPARLGAHRLFDLPEPPDAIFAPSDTQAMGVLKAARERGIAVPSELAVIGFDDVEMSDYIGLTTIRQQLKESGQIAVELLLARMQEPAGSIRQVAMPLTIVQRETA